MPNCPDFAPYQTVNGFCSNVPPVDSAAAGSSSSSGSGAGDWYEQYQMALSAPSSSPAGGAAAAVTDPWTGAPIANPVQIVEDILATPRITQTSRASAQAAVDEAQRQAAELGIAAKCRVTEVASPFGEVRFDALCDLGSGEQHDAELLITRGGWRVAQTEEANRGNAFRFSGQAPAGYGVPVGSDPNPGWSWVHNLFGGGGASAPAAPSAGGASPAPAPSPSSPPAADTDTPEFWAQWADSFGLPVPYVKWGVAAGLLLMASRWAFGGGGRR